MTYKYGNWYCKPANESEAREIVERAVASGAEIYETVGLSHGDHEYEWDLLDVWGVLKGRTFTGDTDCGGSFVCATEYTITQVRKKFPLKGEQQTGWNGEGLPPVGTVCEARLGVEWHQCEVLKNKVNDAGMEVVACDFGFSLAWSANFRPLRTEREHWVEQSLKVLQEDPCALPSQLMGRIYDALKLGTLKAPKVE